MDGKIYDFIQIVNLSKEFPKRKTQTFQVRNIVYDIDLGWIKWHPGWRCYAFFPEEGCFFEEKCLTNITEFLSELKKEKIKDGL